ncbi:glucosamine-6-phosphate deaminase [Entomoplasma freundtii]|uniref:Glucosamine-6-phosphate deaminase n=1 Tax=Entomoplasma freundtii TaxID=74700 RepID=A0A2K8NQX3_9MOLU|nr:glucosamine-6-phosphate deaminase [Entomoplasma freundtii]ATZ16187.1 glucosamine-6-phosphate deaminase [Entomoplasma freundtii]TDY56912.1 glucosamine-6-phosphate deaminase [Entomoplasma freundtii]
MKVIKVKNSEEAGLSAATIISNRIHNKPNLVLGLATGSTPLPTYECLIADHKQGKLSFVNVTTFNLDEYRGLSGSHPQSYRFFMNENLFKNIDIRLDKTFVPNGLDPNEATNYDNLIAQAGGIDLQILGLGLNGHIGFNEPGTSFNSLTHIVGLTDSTIEANARFFDSKDEVPNQAISMGLKSIMNAKEILLIATGKNKAQAVAQLVKGNLSEEWPCTILQTHPNCTIILDEAAASQLNE